MLDSAHITLLRAGFEAYLQRLQLPLEPADQYLPYDFPYVSGAKWRFMADAMLLDELREVTNRIHEWRDMLRCWQAWNGVVATYDQDKAWDLRREFMEPLMHTCLVEPSAFRDLLTFVGTNALHQVRIHAEQGYKDALEGDPSPTDPTPRPLTRRQQEARLSRLATPLTGSDKFVESIRLLDDDDYRRLTKNYRNLNSHAIGPRLALGITKMVTRKVSPAMEMVKQPDGTGRLAPDRDRFVPSYTFGGFEPLDLEVARTANLTQYQRARASFSHFTALLNEHCTQLPRTDA